MNRRGLVLVEALVGLMLFAVVGLAVLSAFFGMAKETETTSDYTLALLLSQKVLDEMVQSMEDDPYGDLFLDTLGTAPRPIARADQPYFEALEDTNPPYGRLEPGPDLAIDERDPTLLRLFSNWSMQVSVSDPEAANSPNRALITAGVNFGWTVGAGQQRNFRMPVFLARSQAVAEGATEWPVNAQAEEAIVDLLYPAQTGTPLVDVIARLNADPGAVRDLGAVVTATAATLTEISELQRAYANKEKSLTSRNRPAAGDLEKWLALGRAQEHLAAQVWSTLVGSYGPLARLVARQPRRVWNTNTEPTLLASIALLDLLTKFPTELTRRTALALDCYLNARLCLPANYMRVHRQLLIEKKVLELAELVQLLTGNSDASFVREWIDFLAETYRGRNRPVQHFLEHERRYSRNLASLYPGVANRIRIAKACAQFAARATTQLTAVSVAKEIAGITP